MQIPYWLHLSLYWSHRETVGTNAIRVQCWLQSGMPSNRHGHCRHQRNSFKTEAVNRCLMILQDRKGQRGSVVAVYVCQLCNPFLWSFVAIAGDIIWISCCCRSPRDEYLVAYQKPRRRGLYVWEVKCSAHRNQTIQGLVRYTISHLSW